MRSWPSCSAPRSLAILPPSRLDALVTMTTTNTTEMPMPAAAYVIIEVSTVAVMWIVNAPTATVPPEYANASALSIRRSLISATTARCVST